MANPTPPVPFLLALLLLLILPFIFSPSGEFVRFAEAGKRRVHITDDLDDVLDDEEDDTWKEWGKKTKPSSDFDPPPDLSKMDMSQIQAEMMKRQTGPAFGFVKLRMGEKRTRDTVAELAMKWTQVLRTGAIEARFMGVDLNTIMFNMERGQDTTELKEFALKQPEAYEIKIGDQVFRRPGDPPLEELVEKLRDEKKRKESDSATESNIHLKEEL
ncbi:hypothetical protein TB2_000655 [Malus domestica]|uniref:Mesoderm development candidate 2 n=1 Tax=Malus domestica TaxID=3750 RepID=A0A498KK53_MALDO|nr:uncharacterized protein LOC103405140 [Malus domestica]XP_050150536.1 uncharacterized protein LOC126625500 [Malus sylvestris]RXI08108.1 hypothetical protein DVH24_014674 [Malus domestica]